MNANPINQIVAPLLESFRVIEPSQPTKSEKLWPCSLVLTDGTAIPRAIAQNNQRFSDAGDWINPEQVAVIIESPYRMPPELANQLYQAGESGMGYTIYTMHLNDGRSIVIASGWIMDFPDLPEGVTSKDIVSVEPHVGRERTIRGDYRHDADFAWLDFAYPDDS